MAVNKDFLMYIQDQLSNFGDFEVKRMFGGIGIFKEGLMFAMIAGNTFKLKVDQSNEKDYEERGIMTQSSNKNMTKKGMPYLEVPQEILDDRKALAIWAQKSHEIAISAALKKNSKSKRKR